MAQYEVTWTETRTYTARIQAPENDERMIEAAATGELVDWAVQDVASGAAVAITGFADRGVMQVTALGKVLENGEVKPL